MTIHQRPTPLRQPIATFGDLSAWLDKRLTGIEEDLDDDETAQAHGSRLRERRATLLDVAHAIREAVETEAADAVADREYDIWKEHYRDLDPVNDALEIRRLSGDR
jgi:hypothetical protein